MIHNTKGYKGFNPDWTCRDFQYEPDKVFTYEGKIKVGSSGLHYSTWFNDILDIYKPNNSIYSTVEAYGFVSVNNSTNYCCTNELKIKKEISIDDIFNFITPFNPVTKDIKPIIDRDTCLKSKKQRTYLLSEYNQTILAITGSYSTADTRTYSSISASTGSYSNSISSGTYSIAASTGYSSLIRTKHYSSIAASTGNTSILQSEDVYSITASTGNQSFIRNKTSHSVAVSTGTESKLESLGDYSVSINTGNYGDIFSNGENSVAVSTGNNNLVKVTNKNSVAVSTGNGHVTTSSPNSIVVAAGYLSKAKGAIGSWLVLTEYSKGGKNIKDVQLFYVDGVKVKENTYYKLVNGKLTEELQLSEYSVKFK